LTDAIGHHSAAHKFHCVIDCHTCRNTAAGRINIHVNIFFGILHLEKKQLGDNRVGYEIIDCCPQKNDAIFE
jgi:hypothetical protein